MIFFKRIRSLSWSALRWLLAFYLIGLLVSGSLLRFFVYQNLPVLDPDLNREFLGRLDQLLVQIFWIFFCAGLLFAFFFVRRFFSPLAILIGKAKSIRRGYYGELKGAIIKESRGEWYQLDLALSQISKDLKRKKDEIVKERGELEALLTAATDAILAVDRDLNIRYYNSPMASLFDQSDGGHWGKNLQEVIRTQAVLDAFAESFQHMRPRYVQVSHVFSNDTSTRYYQVSISPFFDEKKTNVRGAVAIFHDITEHKKIEKVRVDFVANASHELKTPLTSIQGYVSLIKDLVPQDETIQGPLKIVESNVERLNRLVMDLLELSRIESLEFTIREKIHLRSFTQEILDQLRYRIDEKKHEVVVEYKCEEVFAAPDLLHHVLMNLIENAVKYCSEGARIRVRWIHEKGFTLLSVKDNGPGIESYHQKRIFERFYRVREGKKSPPGTGLGLSIVRNSAQRMGGMIDLKSAPGLGSDFICYIPDQ